MMKDDKILNRIRNLLDMAADVGSPNEAVIAARRARALMDKHQVSEWDLKTSKPEDFGQARHIRIADWAGRVAVAMAWLNDVNVHREPGKRGLMQIVFSGYLVDAVTAKELYIYLLAKAQLLAKDVRGSKVDFLNGFASGVQLQVKGILKEREALKMSDGTSLVVSKKAMVEERFGERTYSRTKVRQGANFSAGQEQGRKVGLNRQVSGSGQRRLS